MPKRETTFDVKLPEFVELPCRRGSAEDKHGALNKGRGMTSTEIRMRKKVNKIYPNLGEGMATVLLPSKTSSQTTLVPSRVNCHKSLKSRVPPVMPVPTPPKNKTTRSLTVTAECAYRALGTVDRKTTRQCGDQRNTRKKRGRRGPDLEVKEGTDQDLARLKSQKSPNGRRFGSPSTLPNPPNRRHMEEVMRCNTAKVRAEGETELDICCHCIVAMLNTHVSRITPESFPPKTTRARSDGRNSGSGK